MEVEEASTVARPALAQVGVEPGGRGKADEVPLRAEGLHADLGPVQVVPDAPLGVDRLEQLEAEPAVPGPAPADTQAGEVEGQVEPDDPRPGLVRDRPQHPAHEVPPRPEPEVAA